jgi:hypothetical protein
MSIKDAPQYGQTDDPEEQGSSIQVTDTTPILWIDPFCEETDYADAAGARNTAATMSSGPANPSTVSSAHSGGCSIVLTQM